MKILYAIQGTGNGHLSRAKDIIPLLKTKGDVDILISGIQADISLPYEVTYKLRGFSFIFGKNGGIDFFKTIKNFKLRQLFREVRSIPIKQYDLIINDFEPIAAWAAYLKGIPTIGLSHQNAVLNTLSPQNKKVQFERWLLKYYAPTTYQYGFHFKKYDDSIFTPVIRKEIRDLQITNKKHYTVYLPAYSDEKIIKHLSCFKNIKWEVFSKNSDTYYFKNNIIVQPIENEHFLKSIASCEGVLCGAGFETPAEALFLKKKLLVIPMKNQFEQQCNAVALREIGVPVLKKLGKKQLRKINKWLKSSQNIKVDFPDETAQIINQILHNYIIQEEKPIYQSIDSLPTFSK
ncbi:glycosyl transferase [Polaribacter pacificus]|uniref:Glycosyl transferase n=1 Tax=Polaribacter pacificus TaxID=1775173 RepID=A0A917I1B6_9FLAO|nr:glycosyltransferase family protein [Polaribacter pacificus]GGH03418.1 glycosyl transferase [Polaribacter pacificus]